MEQTPQYVVLTKTCIGSLTLTLRNPATGLVQRIIMRPNEEKRMIPVSTAALVYTDPYGGAYRMYKEGYFAFDDAKKVYDYAYNQGLIIGDPAIVEQATGVNHLQDIRKALLSGNRLEIDRYFNSDKGIEDVVRVAREVIGDLKQAMIKYVEEKAGVSLTAEGE